GCGFEQVGGVVELAVFVAERIAPAQAEPVAFEARVELVFVATGQLFAARGADAAAVLAVLPGCAQLPLPGCDRAAGCGFETDDRCALRVDRAADALAVIGRADGVAQILTEGGQLKARIAVEDAARAGVGVQRALG